MQMDTVSINSITRLRINSDGEGVRSVLFLQGCPLDCFWCCNPETRFSPKFRKLTGQQLYSYLREDVPYFLFSGGGITFSGGEPLLQAAFIRDFILNYCEGFTVDLETSLFASWETVESLIPYINLWNVDFKIFDDSCHLEYTGKSNINILENIRRLARTAGPERVLITYPVIPGYNDSQENMEAMIAFLKGNGLKRVEVHPYRKGSEEKHRKLNREARDLPELSTEQYKAILNRFRENDIRPVQRTTIFSKEKCEFLKGIRRDICREWKLDVDIAECPVTEGCIGTCPKCEQELYEIMQHRDRQSWK